MKWVMVFYFGAVQTPLIQPKEFRTLHECAEAALTAVYAEKKDAGLSFVCRNIPEGISLSDWLNGRDM